MNASATVVGAEPVTDLVYAGFWRRLAALLIDGLVLGVLSSLFGSVLGSEGGLSALLGFLVSTAYQVYFFTRTGQTLGARVMAIKVVDLDGHLLSVDLAAIRAVGAYVSGALLGLGYLLMLLDARKQTLHDKMAGSVVVKA